MGLIAVQATEALRITGKELVELNVVDEVIPVSSSLNLEIVIGTFA